MVLFVKRGKLGRGSAWREDSEIRFGQIEYKILVELPGDVVEKRVGQKLGTKVSSDKT